MRLKTELEGANLGDERLNTRLNELASLLESNHGGAISRSCGDWKNAKAAYRFLDNARFSETDIIAPHLGQTAQRVNRATQQERVLVVHDTTEFNHTEHEGTEGLGYLTGHELSQKTGLSFTKGYLMHASLAITDSGIPLGLLYSKQWCRELKNLRKVRNEGKNYTRVPIEEKESFKWMEGISQACAPCNGAELVHVCDRDGDIYELFEHCESLNTSFVVRGVHGRGTVVPGEKSFSRLSKTAKCGSYSLKLQSSKKRTAREARIDVRFYRVKLIPPIAKKSICAPVEISVVSAKERGSSRVPQKERINWKLLTNEPVESFDDALRIIGWYQARWSIEVFFKTMKSGFGLEKCRLRHANRLKKFTALVSIVAWRVFWITRISRASPSAPPTICYARIELKALNKVEIKAGRELLEKQNCLEAYTVALARLGGYLARKSDPPPGDTVIWRGFQRLRDLVELT